MGKIRRTGIMGETEINMEEAIWKVPVDMRKMAEMEQELADLKELVRKLDTERCKPIISLNELVKIIDRASTFINKGKDE